MRDIEFRAISTDSWEKGFVYGKGIVQVSKDTYLQNEWEMVRGVNYDELDYWMPSYYTIDIDIDTLGQYTGFSDKCGKKIFEGDILKIDVDKAYVHWNEEYGYFQLIPIGEYCFDSDVIGHVLEDIKVKIIGNIYQNKELLEK